MLIDEFSYASPNDPLPRKLGIRCVELLTGQPYLKRLYRDYQHAGLPHDRFFDEAVDRLELNINWHGAPIEKIPARGPLIFVANHPYGVLDGIVICLLAARARGDFKILINSVLCRAPELEDYVLPVDFEPTQEALQTNLASRKTAREHLSAGGSLIVFPAGAVSTTPKILAREAFDEDWAPLVGQLIRRTEASVVPVFFGGQNSLPFQLASHVSYALRVALIFREVRRRIGSSLDVVVGETLDFADLEQYLPPANLARMLQAHTHALAEVLDKA